jgi:hypothetical protein
VINASWAGGGVDDTASVVREHGVTSSEGNGENTLIEGSFVLGNGISLNLLVVCDSNITRSSSASTLSSSVWVLALGHLSVLSQVLPGIEVPSTIASMGSFVAVNKLLLREVQQFSGSSVVSMLGTSSGSERPAGTTSTLVFDGIHLTSPVFAHTILALIENSWLHGVILWWHGT